MKKMLLLLSMASAIPASAQVSISYEEFAAGYGLSLSSNSDSYSSTDLSGVPALIATSGTNKTWDFGGRVYTKDTASASKTASFVDVNTAPLSSDPDLAGATHCIKVTDATTNVSIYSYSKLNSTGLYTVGTVMDSAGTAMKISAYKPPMQVYAFPIAYGTTWTSTSDVISLGSFPGVTNTIKVESTVDGYGNLTVPAKSQKGNNQITASNECLRIKSTNTNTYTIGGNSISTITHIYKWETKDVSSASVSSNIDDVPTSISYSRITGSTDVPVSIEDPLTMKLSANPAASQTVLSYSLPESGAVKVSMMDNLGREVKMLHNGFAPAGSNVIPIDPSSMTNGTYLIRVSSNSFTGTRKLIIAK